MTGSAIASHRSWHPAAGARVAAGQPTGRRRWRAVSGAHDHGSGRRGRRALSVVQRRDARGDWRQVLEAVWTGTRCHPRDQAGAQRFARQRRYACRHEPRGSISIVPPIDLTNARLRKLAAALGPAYVRVSGTWANTTYFPTSDKAPDHATAPASRAC